jgi:hypothetical protein
MSKSYYSPCRAVQIFASYSPILLVMATEGRHRVYIAFMVCRGWHCQFLEADLKTSLPRTLTFAKPDKIIELVERGGGFKDLAERQAMDHAIAMGRGGVYLNLTDEQYRKLKQ